MASTSTVRKHTLSAAAASSAVSIADAKSHFSEVISTVEHRRQPVTILRRGRAVAQIIPVQDTKPSLYGAMRGTVVELGDIVSPTGGEWSVGGE